MTDIDGYFYYENNFTLYDLHQNSFRTESDNYCVGQFKATLYRQMNTSFILVVTVNIESDQGEFSITVDGPSKVSMKQLTSTYSLISC